MKKFIGGEGKARGAFLGIVILFVFVPITYTEAQKPTILSKFYKCVEKKRPWESPILKSVELDPSPRALSPILSVSPEIPPLASKGDTFIMPGDTLWVTGTWTHEGNIYVLGAFIAKNADISLEGNIIALYEGLVDIDSSNISVIQHYIHEHLWGAIDSSTFRIRNSTTSYSGFGLQVYAGGPKSIFEWQNVWNADWTSATAAGGATVNIREVNVAGEWAVDDSATLNVSHVNFLIPWFIFREGDSADITLPPSPVYGFVMDSTYPGVSGIDYRVSIDSVDTVQWACFSYKGSDVILRDSEIRAIAVILAIGDTVVLDSIVSHQSYTNYTFPIIDRELSLINSYLESWNIYPGGFYPDTVTEGTNLTLTNSIIGEMIAFGRSRVFLSNNWVDGSGGAFQVHQHSGVMCLLSYLTTNVLTQDGATAVIGYSLHLYGDAWATDSSKLIYVSTDMNTDPVPYDSAEVWVANIEEPDTGYVLDGIDLIGSAWVDGGPLNSVDMTQYQIFYRLEGDSDWIKIDTLQTKEVPRDTLIHWTTDTLGPGSYELMLIVWGTDTLIDSIIAKDKIELLPGHKIAEKSTGLCLDLRLITTWGEKIKIQYMLPTAAYVELSAYSVDGRKRGVIVNHHRTAGMHTDYWKPSSSGVYFIRLKAQDNITTQKAIWIK